MSLMLYFDNISYSSTIKCNSAHGLRCCAHVEMVRAQSYWSENFFIRAAVNMLTNSMEKSSFWEAKGHSASQEIPPLHLGTIFTTACHWS